MSVEITGPSVSTPLELIVTERRVPEDKLVVPGAKVSSNLNFMRYWFSFLGEGIYFRLEKGWYVFTTHDFLVTAFAYEINEGGEEEAEGGYAFFRRIPKIRLLTDHVHFRLPSVCLHSSATKPT